MGFRLRRSSSGLILASAVALVAIIAQISAQNAPPTSLSPVVSHAAAFAVSGPLANMPPDDTWSNPADAADWNGTARIIAHGPLRENASDPGTTDGALQTSGPEFPNIPAPSLGFEGLSNQDNLIAVGTLVSPPDTNGDVGPNHYVQSTNVLFRVWDKNGNPLTAPLRLSSLFAPLGAPCSLLAKGDPIVLYDPLADRWLVSQLGFATNPVTPPYFECIAISQTPDPTGAYFLYAFQTAGIEFPDYPKLGVWPDGYYMTVNQFTGGGPSNGTGAYAFDRARMLVGDPAASYVYFNLSETSYPEGIVGMLPSDFDGLIPPPAGRPNTFAYFTSLAFGGKSDALRLFDFHADFINPANSTFSERPESPVGVATFNPANPLSRADIQQPPPATSTTGALDSISDRLMHRLQYRNFGDRESLVANHTVGATPSRTIGTYRAGIRYYQLSSTGGAFGVAEQATYAPADGLNRWMGSAATDNQGNLAVGFSTSSVSSFPSIAYAGRLASDPPGGLFHGENTLVAGSGVQQASNRWGDYSALTVDPSDDCTFWYTSEYYTAASQATSVVGWVTRIGSFKFAECTAPPQGTLQGLITDAATGTPLAGAFIQISNGLSQTSLANGTYSRRLAPGTYTVTVFRSGFAPASVGGVVIADGATTTLNVALSGIALVVSGNAAIAAEGFSPANGAIDAAETVTLDFTLRNVGFGSTVGLTATLMPSGGVLDPSGPQNYGAIPASGAGTRSFTFRADPSLGCGGTLTASLQLKDGAADLGIVTFQFLLAGNLRAALAENFDGVAIPALPSGWVAANLDASPVLWGTTNSLPDTPPNDAIVAAPAVASDKTLVSPAFAIQTATAQLSFRNFYNLQTGFDGGVLEISLDGGPFADILSAGGSFLENGYNSTISSTVTGLPPLPSPLAGRAAWSGSLSGYVTTRVNLPAAAAGRMVKLRWRMGSNNSISSLGWRIDTISVTELVSACTFNILATGSTIAAESFVPGNGAIDAGETVTANLTLRNFGSAATTDLVATLLPMGGVLDPSGPQNYGAFKSGGGGGGGGGVGAVTRSFTFRADPLLGCGGTLSATLHLVDGSTDLGTVTFKFVLAGSNVIAFAENFDSVIPPALPSGWTATSLEASPVLWATTPTIPDTPPNEVAIVASSPVVSDRRLDSPAIAIQTTSAQLTFRSFYILQPGFDGGVLEISLNGGAFTDILTAGGSFALNGYNNTISNATGNPLGGRAAWSANLTGYVTTIVNLPPSAAGQTVKLRWRLGSDNSIASPGWRVDTISLTEVAVPCAFNLLASSSAITAESFFPANSAVDPGEQVTVDFTLRNAGTQATSNLAASLLPTGGVTNPDGPQTYGTIAANGGTGTKSFTFRAEPTLACGSGLVATQGLLNGGVDLGTVKFNLKLGALNTLSQLSQNFDGVTAPLLPAGWTASNLDASPVLWVTTTALADTAPNAAFVDDPLGVSDKRLDSPVFAVQTAVAQLRFRNNFSLDTQFDGGVLEISLDGGPFEDILAAGGSFVEGGYTAAIIALESNPLDGRMAWTGNSGGYITTIVNLPAAAAGHMAQLRWRMGSGLNFAGIGWRVDSITLTENAVTCAVKSNTSTVVTSSGNPSTYGDSVTFTAVVSAVAPGSGIPGGTVTFNNGNTVLASGVPLDSQGTASLTLPALTAGSHTIIVDYNGTPDYAFSSGRLTQTVDKATPTINWTNPADIDYPTPLGGSQLNATASWPGGPAAGTFDYTPAADAVLAPGSHTLAVTFTPTDTGNFNTPTPANVTINVKPTFALTTTLAGTGTGTVSGSGISCGTDCSERYPSSTVDVTLTAVAAPGSVFLGWSGDCTGTDSCTVPMNQDRNATATFAHVSTTGRMTGDGTLLMTDGVRVDYKMELSCSGSAKLKINWKQNQFQLDAMTSALCYDDASIAPGRANADFDTIIAAGTGKLNGQPATIELKFTDAEPGPNDTATLVIQQGSTVVLSLSGKVIGDNQAHAK